MTDRSHSEQEPLKIRIRDLTMATYLLGVGHKATMSRDGQTRSGHPLGCWEFDPGEQVKADMELYEKGLAKVEPRSFYISVKRTRASMFKYLGVA